MSVDRTIGAIGDVFAAVAAGAGVWAVIAAQKTIRLTRQAEREAEAARAEAARDRELQRVEASRERKRQENERQRNRWVRISELVERLYWEAAQGREWFPTRNLLALETVGLADLPQWVGQIENVSTSAQASDTASRAREECRARRAQLEQERQALELVT